MKNFQNIKNIVFDLGGVLFKLSPTATIEEFGRHGIENIEETYREVVRTEWFRDFEIGNISVEKFRNLMNDFCKVDINQEEFAKCWNAMIDSYPTENQQFIEKLRKRFNLYILSNTNEIHVKYFEPMSNWRDGLFVKKYYSNEIHLRKPDLECFEYVINDANIKPEESIFIDDRLENIEGAKKAGFNTIHLTKQSDLYTQFEF